jgi:ATPase family associated with various cellular activities (AAA)
MASPRYQQASLGPIEQAVVDLVRLGLRGDTSSIRQLGRNLMSSRAPAEPAASPEFRERLGTLLLDAGRSGGSLRTLNAGALPVDPETRLPLVSVDPHPAGPAPALNENERAVVSTILGERTRASVLLEAGLEPPKTLLLSGPPGVGKTMTARHIANRLGLPLVTVELAAIMSSFLGKTGQNLRQLLDHARGVDCVLLLDEFDALAKRRDDQSDVGELKRLVNVLLLELDRWPPGGLLIAATNHPHLLDPAVGRRFDIHLDLALPDLGARIAILTAALDRLGQTPDATLVSACALALDGTTGADLERLVKRTTRAALLGSTPLDRALAEVALEPLRNGAPSDTNKRAAFCTVAHDNLGISNREIAKLIGVTHPTVAELCRRWRRQNDDPPSIAGVGTTTS